MADVRLHHKKSSFCASRPKYREARWERAVKVYTINLESKYLLVQGIPALDVTKDLLETFAIYGVIEEYRILDDYPGEEFTKVYWIKFKHIMAARKAKRKLDNRSFFGGILHVSYAPEFETVEETTEKLMDRKKFVRRKIKCFERETEGQHGSHPGKQHSQIGGHNLQTEYQNSPTERHSSQGERRSDDPHSILPKSTLRCFAPERPQVPGDELETSTDVPYEEEKYADMPARLPPLSVDQYPSQIPTISTTWNYPQVPTNHTTLSANTHTLSQPHTVANESERIHWDQKDNFEPVKSQRKRQETIGRTAVKADVATHSDLTQSLTGNSSMDRTVLSIRERLNRIKNSRRLNLCSEAVDGEQDEGFLFHINDEVKNI